MLVNNIPHKTKLTYKTKINKTHTNKAHATNFTNIFPMVLHPQN